MDSYRAYSIDSGKDFKKKKQPKPNSFFFLVYKISGLLIFFRSQFHGHTSATPSG